MSSTSGVTWFPAQEIVSQSKSFADKQKRRFRNQYKRYENIIGSTKRPTKSWRRWSWTWSQRKSGRSWRKKWTIWKPNSINTLKVILKVPLPSKRSVVMVSLSIWLWVHIVESGLPKTFKSLNIFVHNSLQTLGTWSFYKLQRVQWVCSTHWVGSNTEQFWKPACCSGEE